MHLAVPVFEPVMPVTCVCIATLQWIKLCYVLEFLLHTNLIAVFLVNYALIQLRIRITMYLLYYSCVIWSHVEQN